MPSTVISFYRYDKEKQTLDVGFISGSVYRYLDVPETVAVAMKASASKGVYLNTVIKPAYKFQKLK